MTFLLKLSPARMDIAVPEIEKRGDTLVINGDAYDFGFMGDGDSLPLAAVNSAHIVGDVSRNGDVISVEIILPHSATAPQYVLFPAPIIVETDGLVELPKEPPTLPGEANAN